MANPTVASRLASLIEEALAVRGIVLRKSRRSNHRQDPSISAADGEPSNTLDAEPNCSVRLVGDASDPDRALAVRIGGVWYYAQLSASASTALLDAHLDGDVSKHDATEIDYERADGSKKNIAAGSDSVEAALTNLDDATGLLSSLTTTAKTSIVAAINEIVTNVTAAQADIAEIGAENTDIRVAVPLTGVKDGGTWTPTVTSGGLASVTRTAAAGGTSYWLDVPIPARTTAMKGAQADRHPRQLLRQRRQRGRRALRALEGDRGRGRIGAHRGRPVRRQQHSLRCRA